MMQTWRREISTALIGFFAVMVIGGFTGWFFPLLFFLLLVLLIMQTREINRLERWLSTGALRKAPKSKGIWEEIYYHIYLLKKKEKRRKKRLRKILEQFRRSTSALPDAAVVLGEHDEIEWINKSAREVLGLKKSDKGQRIPNLIRQPEFIRYLNGLDKQATVTLPAPVDDALILEYKLVNYTVGLRLLLAHDVTQLHKMERMRRDFVANVSHELRTPLTVLKGYLETLQDRDNEYSPQVAASFQQMFYQTGRMQHLVDDLLLLARLETRQKEVRCVAVVDLLEKICKESDMRQAVRPRIELTIESSAKIQGDGQELRSAFSNLLMNALKYSPEDAKVQVRWHEDDAGIKLDVIDQGEGIAAVHIPRITERFYRVDVARSHSPGGTGLGLAIVKHVLVRHDAVLQISSEIGKGSCFSCIFPHKRTC